MSRDWRFYLNDMQESARRVISYTVSMDRADFFRDQRTVDAVIRNLEIIGEAAGRIPEEGVLKYPNISFARMKAFRNLLSHVYFGVDEDILWDVVSRHIPELLANLGDPPPPNES